LGANSRGRQPGKKKVSIGFLNRVAICRQFGRWPFATPPEGATLAQVEMYLEALEQLKTPASIATPGDPAGEAQPTGPARPRKLKREAWEELKRKAKGS
jgi:hypothetical protein